MIENARNHGGGVIQIELAPSRDRRFRLAVEDGGLAWSIENLVEGDIVNEIKVDDETARLSLIALQRMLEVS